MLPLGLKNTSWYYEVGSALTAHSMKFETSLTDDLIKLEKDSTRYNC